MRLPALRTPLRTLTFLTFLSLIPCISQVLTVLSIMEKQAALGRRPEAPPTRFTVGRCWFNVQLLPVSVRFLARKDDSGGRERGAGRRREEVFLVFSAPFSAPFRHFLLKPTVIR